jgi:hypothetical protein
MCRLKQRAIGCDESGGQQGDVKCQAGVRRRQLETKRNL